MHAVGESDSTRLVEDEIEEGEIFDTPPVTPGSGSSSITSHDPSSEQSQSRYTSDTAEDTESSFTDKQTTIFEKQAALEEELEWLRQENATLRNREAEWQGERKELVNEIAAREGYKIEWQPEDVEHAGPTNGGRIKKLSPEHGLAAHGDENINDNSTVNASTLPESSPAKNPASKASPRQFNAKYVSKFGLHSDLYQIDENTFELKVEGECLPTPTSSSEPAGKRVHVSKETNQLLQAVALKVLGQTIDDKEWRNVTTDFKTNSRRMKQHHFVWALHWVILYNFKPEDADKKDPKAKYIHSPWGWVLVKLRPFCIFSWNEYNVKGAFCYTHDKKSYLEIPEWIRENRLQIQQVEVNGNETVDPRQPGFVRLANSRSDAQVQSYISTLTDDIPIKTPMSNYDRFIVVDDQDFLWDEMKHGFEKDYEYHRANKGVTISPETFRIRRKTARNSKPQFIGQVEHCRYLWSGRLTNTAFSNGNDTGMSYEAESTQDMNTNAIAPSNTGQKRPLDQNETVQSNKRQKTTVQAHVANPSPPVVSKPISSHGNAASIPVVPSNHTVSNTTFERFNNMGIDTGTGARQQPISPPVGPRGLRDRLGRDPRRRNGYRR